MIASDIALKLSEINLVMPLVVMVLAAFIGLAVNHYVQQEFSYHLFKGTKGFGIRSRVKYPTSTGSILCRVNEATNRKMIVLETLEQPAAKIFLPMKGHQARDWVVMNPELPEPETEVYNVEIMGGDTYDASNEE